MVSACLASFGSTFASNVLIPPTQIGAAQSQECGSHLGQRRDQQAHACDDDDKGEDRVEVLEDHRRSRFSNQQLQVPLEIICKQSYLQTFAPRFECVTEVGQHLEWLTGLLLDDRERSIAVLDAVRRQGLGNEVPLSVLLKLSIIVNFSGPLDIARGNARRWRGSHFDATNRHVNRRRSLKKSVQSSLDDNLVRCALLELAAL